LEEVLVNYNKNKIIILEFNNLSIDQINRLYLLLSNYHYRYYYLTNDNLNNTKLLEIGSILENYIKTDNVDEIKDNLFIISKYPEKINKRLKSRQI